MEDFLINKGFYSAKKCSCGGTLTITFLKLGSNIMVKIKPKRNYFEIYVSNKLQEKGNANIFELTLNKYVI